MNDFAWATAEAEAIDQRSAGSFIVGYPSRVRRWTARVDGRSDAATATGALVSYFNQDLQASGLRLFPGVLREPHRAVYIIDDGRTVEPWYVAGWSSDGGFGLSTTDPRVTLHRFPTNGRTADGRPTDFRSWMLAPSRCYHLKVSDYAG